jgi:hypothetical protein
MTEELVNAVGGVVSTGLTALIGVLFGWIRSKWNKEDFRLLEEALDSVASAVVDQMESVVVKKLKGTVEGAKLSDLQAVSVRREALNQAKTILGPKTLNKLKKTRGLTDKALDKLIGAKLENAKKGSALWHR